MLGLVRVYVSGVFRELLEIAGNRDYESCGLLRIRLVAMLGDGIKKLRWAEVVGKNALIHLLLTMQRGVLRAQPWVRETGRRLSPFDEVQAHASLEHLELQPFRRPKIYGVPCTIETVAGKLRGPICPPNV